MSDNIPTPVAKPIHVIIEAPMETSWQWHNWFAGPDGQVKLTEPSVSEMNLPLRELGHWGKTPSSFLLNDSSYQGGQGYNPGTKIRAVKIVRALRGIGLKEAKDLVELMILHQDQGLFTYEFRLCL